MNKKVFTLLISIQIFSFAVGQSSSVPQRISYQAIIRDTLGSPIPEQTVSLRFSIIQNDPNGIIVYREIHENIQTNIIGLVNIEIGSGEVQNGSFDKIEWSKGPYYFHIEIATDGSNNYSFVGTNELLSVPYALHSGSTSLPDGLDKDSTNEYQDLELFGDTLHITSGNYVILPSEKFIEDTLNEIQTLSISGDTISISKGNDIILPQRQNNPNQHYFELGEDIVANKAVMVGDGISGYMRVEGGGNEQNLSQFGGKFWFAQTFKASKKAKAIRAINFIINKTDTSYIAISIRKVKDGVPVGPDLVGSYKTYSIMGIDHRSGAKMHFTFSDPVKVEPDSNYAFIVRSLGGITHVWTSKKDTYLGGSFLESSDSGTSFQKSGLLDSRFSIYEVITEPGKIYMSDFSYTTERTIGPNKNHIGFVSGNHHLSLGDLQTNFIGILNENGKENELKSVQIGGIVDGFSNLKIGHVYNLAGSEGQISPTQGFKKVGIAISPTSLLLRQDN